MSLHRDLRHRRQQSRALLEALYRTELQDAGEQLEHVRQTEARELERVGHLVTGAEAAGLSVTEIARLTGLSRQKIYELRERHGSIADLQRSILIQLAAGGAQSADGLTGAVGAADSTELRRRLKTMEDEGLVQRFVTQYGDGPADAWFALTASGQEALERLISYEHEAPRMSVYARIDTDERTALERTAADVLGRDWFAVLPPGTVSGQDWIELAFHVVASGPEEAIARGRERLVELRRAAGLEDRPAIITAVAPGDAWRLP